MTGGDTVSVGDYAVLVLGDERTLVQVFALPRNEGVIVQLADGRLRDVGEQHLHKVCPIDIPISHYNDFISHPGSWAVMYDPKLTAGDPVVFRNLFCPWANMATLVAVVTDCHRMNSARPEDRQWLADGMQHKSLDGWWLIRFDGWFAERSV